MSDPNDLTSIEAELLALGEAPLSAAELEMLQQLPERAELDAASLDDELKRVFESAAVRRPVLDEHARVLKLAAVLKAQSEQVSGQVLANVIRMRPRVRVQSAAMAVVLAVAATTILVWALSPSDSRAPQHGRERLLADDLRQDDLLMVGSEARRSLVVLERMIARRRLATGRDPGGREQDLADSPGTQRSRWARLLAMRVVEPANDTSPAGKSAREPQ